MVSSRFQEHARWTSTPPWPDRSGGSGSSPVTERLAGGGGGCPKLIEVLVQRVEENRNLLGPQVIAKGQGAEAAFKNERGPRYHALGGIGGQPRPAPGLDIGRVVEAGTRAWAVY